METTPNLALPFLAAAQAQKHVTLNEGLRILDALVQAGVRSRTRTAPPDVEDGAAYLVPPDGQAAWGAPAHSLLARVDDAWEAHEPREGWLVHVADEADFVVFRGGSWERLRSFSQDDLVEVPLVGVSTSADGTNRLAVASPASLFTHAGDDHRMTLNKATEGDTASIVFQTAHSGRAEMGLTGGDALTFKVSTDGVGWRTALAIAPSGAVDMPARPTVRAHLNGGWRDTPGGETGFATLAGERGGFELGSEVDDGTTVNLGRRLVVPASGTYLTVLQLFADPGSDFRATLQKQDGTRLAFVQVSKTDGTPATQSTTTLSHLTEGDVLSLHYVGPARCFHASGHTELSLLMV